MTPGRGGRRNAGASGEGRRGEVHGGSLLADVSIRCRIRVYNRASPRSVVTGVEARPSRRSLAADAARCPFSPPPSSHTRVSSSRLSGACAPTDDGGDRFPAEARGPARRRSAHLHATQRASQSNPVVRASSAESLSKHSSPPRPRLASRIRARNVREERNANGVARTTREGKPPCRAVASRRRSPGTSTGARMMCVLSPIASQPRARALASLANLRAAHLPPGPRTSASRPRRPAFARRTAGEVDPRRSSPCAPRAPPPRRARRPAALRAASR